MSAASNENATEWKGYFMYSIEQVKELEKRLQDNKSVSNAVSVKSGASESSDSSNGSFASESSNSSEPLDLLPTPIVLVTKSEADNELHSKLEDLQGKTILAVNYGFINYLLPAQQSRKNLKDLPAELQKKLFFIADDYDPRNPSLDALGSLFVQLLHALNFWIHFASDDDATPLTENLGTTFAYVANAIKQEKEEGRSAAPFGYSLVSGEKRLKDVLPLFALSSDDVNLFIVFDMMERGACAVYHYLRYLTMPSGEKKPKTLTEWLQMQVGLEEGVGGKGIPDLQISYLAMISLFDSERQILKAYDEFLDLNKAIQEDDESVLESFKKKYETILQVFSDAQKDVNDYIAKHDESTAPNVYKREEYATTKKENAKVFARITEIKDSAKEIYKEQAGRLGPDKLPEIKVQPVVVGKLDTVSSKPERIDLAWIEKWIASNFKDRVTDSEKVDKKYKVSQGGLYNFEQFNDYDVIVTPGAGNCLISAILTSISPNYRKVPLEHRDAISERFRSLISNLQTATGDPLFTPAQKTDLCKGGRFLSDDTGFRLAKYLGLNLAYLILYTNGTTRIFSIADEIKGADWILLYNTGASIKSGDSGFHYDAVRAAPSGLFLSKISGLIADFQSKHLKPVVIEDERLRQTMARLKELHDSVLTSIQESSKAGNNEDALKHLRDAETSGTEFGAIADGEILGAIKRTKNEELYNRWKSTIEAAIKNAKGDYAKKWGAPKEIAVAAVSAVPAGGSDANGSFDEYKDQLNQYKDEVLRIVDTLNRSKTTDLEVIDTALRDATIQKNLIEEAFQRKKDEAPAKASNSSNLVRFSNQILEITNKALVKLTDYKKTAAAVAAVKKAEADAAEAARVEEAKQKAEADARAAPVGGGAAGALPGKKTENNYIDDVVGGLEFLDGRIKYIQSLNSVSKKNATNVKVNLGEFDSIQISKTITRIRKNLLKVTDPRKSELTAELEQRIQTLAELQKTIEAHLATLTVPTAPPTAVVPPPVPAPVPPTPAAVLPTLRKTVVEPKPAGASRVAAPVPNLRKTNSASQIKSEIAKLEKELSVVEAQPAKFGEESHKKTLKIQELEQRIRELKLKQGRTLRRNRRTARKTRRNK